MSRTAVMVMMMKAVDKMAGIVVVSFGPMEVFSGGVQVQFVSSRGLDCGGRRGRGGD